MFFYDVTHTLSILRFKPQNGFTGGRKNIFRRKPKINEQTIQKLVQNLETAYINKDIKQLTDMFHLYHRDISFLNHFSLSMNFQIYDVTSTEHTKEFIEGNPVEYSDIIAQEEDYSIIEIKIQGRSGLQHELVLNIVASDGFFMIRFLQSCIP